MAWRLHMLFVTGRHDECAKTIEFIEREQQQQSNRDITAAFSSNEYANLLKSKYQPSLVYKLPPSFLLESHSIFYKLDHYS
jgi:cobalamin biosynthesis Co2+ chelatase CbiK